MDFVEINISSTTSSEVRLIRSEDPELEPEIFLPRENDHLYSVDHDPASDRFLIESNWEAINFRLLETKLEDSRNKNKWKELIPHREEVLLQSVVPFPQHLVIMERENGLRHLKILDKKSKLRGFFEKSKIYISIACYPDNEITIKKIIQNALKGYKGLTLENINLIIESCNLDRDKLRNELSKITSFFSNKSIDKERLDLLLNIRTNENFDSLKNYALNGNKKKTNSLIRDTYIDAEKNILYLNMINRRLTRISEVNENAITTDIETAMSKLRPPVFWKEKAHFVSQTKRWNKEKIKNVLKQTYNLELKLKSNSLINSQILIKKLLIDICVLANS